MENINIRKLIYIGVVILIFPMTGCKKLVEIEAPQEKLMRASAFNDNSTAAAILTGIYMDMASYGDHVSYYTGLSSDELKLNNQDDALKLSFYTNSLSSNNSNLWSDYYNFIYRCNSAIEGLTQSDKLRSDLKARLIAEARFLRGYCYFYLVNLFGDVPLLTTTDYKTNSVASRTHKDLVYKLIIEDLDAAKSTLSEKYVAGDALSKSEQRLRPNKWAASALLARVYLFTKNWNKAIEESDAVIGYTDLYSLEEELDNVFKSNSKEAIWQLQPIDQGQNTVEARRYILQGVPNFDRPFTISDFLFNAFEAGDDRKTKWIGTFTNTEVSPRVDYHYAYKYKVLDGDLVEYSMVLRLSEQYLIRAEALIKSDRIEEGIQDINTIRRRARSKANTLPNPLPDLAMPLSKENALLAVEKERRVEFFTEAGHRWLDINRTDRADVIMSAISVEKGGRWKPTDRLYPIPTIDMQRDPNLKPQNPGY